MTETPASAQDQPKYRPSIEVLKAAARAVVTASKITGHPVDPRVQKLADS